MIKKMLGLALIVGLSGCAGMGPIGLLYTEIKLPSGDLEVESETTAATKIGTTQCVSVLGLIATGDCSVDTARKNGNITRISSVQMHVKNILGLYAEYTTQVLGN